MLNAREIDLVHEAINTHLHFMTAEHNVNPAQEDRMRQFKALLLKIAPVYKTPK